MITIKRTLYVLAIVALALGVYGFWSRLLFGERDVNYGSYVNWGLWVAMYLFFAGLAAGAFMVASLDLLFDVPLFRGTGRHALWTTVVTLPAALALIGLDLGHLERIWKVYLQPSFTSLLAQLVWSYTALFLVAITLVVLLIRGRRRALKPLMAVGVLLAVFVSGGVGALLGVNAGQVSFHNAMLPAQFPVLNLTAGVAALLAIVALFRVVEEPDRRARLLRALGLVLLVLLVAKVYFLWVDYSQVLYSNVPDAVAVVDLVLFGRYAWAFWGLQVALGIVVPMLLILWPRTGHTPLAMGAAGILVLLGLAVGRTAIIFPALAIPDLEGLGEAFTGPHLGFDYVPSLMEWSVAIGVTGLAALAFLVGADRLTFLKNRTEVAS